MGFKAEYGQANAQYGSLWYANSAGSAYSTAVSESVACTDVPACVVLCMASYAESVAASDNDACVAAVAVAFAEGVAALDQCVAIDETLTPSDRTFSIIRENRSS